MSDARVAKTCDACSAYRNMPPAELFPNGLPPGLSQADSVYLTMALRCARDTYPRSRSDWCSHWSPRNGAAQPS